jgi:hypothetical protein
MKSITATNTDIQMNGVQAAGNSPFVASANHVHPSDTTKANLASPSFTTPTLGVATATSINKVTVTAPTTSATLTLVQGSTLQTTGAFALNLTSTAASTPTFPAGTSTLAALGVAALTPSAAITWTPAAPTNVWTLVPNATGTLTLGTAIAGQSLYLVVTTSGTTSYTITFAGNIKTATTTLATGTVTAKTFVIQFICSTTTTCYEVSRTAAI